MEDNERQVTGVQRYFGEEMLTVEAQATAFAPPEKPLSSEELRFGSLDVMRTRIIGTYTNGTNKEPAEIPLVQYNRRISGTFYQIVAREEQTAQRDSVLDYDHLFKCVQCFDLDADAVEMCRLSVTETLDEYGIPHDLSRLIAKKWVQCADFLLYDDIPADFVVGNPPYLRSTEIPTEAREQYVAKFSAMTKACDIFVAFFQKGLESIRRADGVLCYICADRWMQNKYGRKLRELISSGYHIDALVRMHDVDVFEMDVSAYPAITKIDIGQGSIKYADCSASFNEDSTAELKEWFYGRLENYSGKDFSAAVINHPQNGAVIPLANPRTLRNITKLMERCPTLEDSGVKIGIGLATGKDDVYIVDNPDVAEEDRMLPVFSMRDWRKRRNTADKWLVNPWNKDGSLVSLADYPRMKTYFESPASLAGAFICIAADGEETAESTAENAETRAETPGAKKHKAPRGAEAVIKRRRQKKAGVMPSVSAARGRGEHEKPAVTCS